MEKHLPTREEATRFPDRVASLHRIQASGIIRVIRFIPDDQLRLAGTCLDCIFAQVSRRAMVLLNIRASSPDPASLQK